MFGAQLLSWKRLGGCCCRLGPRKSVGVKLGLVLLSATYHMGFGFAMWLPNCGVGYNTLPYPCLFRHRQKPKNTKTKNNNSNHVKLF
jgi:hypothetical protein